MNAKEKERQEAIEYLKGIIKPGDTIYTSLRHVSRSGMYRVISLYVMLDNHPMCIDWKVAQLLEGYDERWNGCKAGGCGIDMGFHLVYNLSYALYGKGWPCVGARCPSADHCNNWQSPRGEGVIHVDGYALKQQWM